MKVDLSVEHILLFVILVFLLYHLLGNCRYIEGFDCMHTKSLADKEFLVLSCSNTNDRLNLIELADKWCSQWSGMADGEEMAKCTLNGCIADVDDDNQILDTSKILDTSSRGAKFSCVSQKILNP